MFACLALLLLIAVHLATNLVAWSQVALIADDRFAVGLPILMQLEGKPWFEQLVTIFCRQTEANATTALYRPFVDLSYWLELPWFGISPVGYHAVNSLFHVTTALAWCLLVRRWSGSALAGLAVGLLFVGWPGHSEATHWIAARTNLQSLCFVSLSMLAFDAAELRPDGSRRWPLRALALGCAVVAFGSKESAILLLPMAFLATWLRAAGERRRWQRSARCALRMLPLLAAFLGWACWRRYILHTWGAGTQSAWSLDVHSPLAWAQALWRWLQLLSAPLHAEYASPWWRPVLWGLHGGLLLAAGAAFRHRALRPALGLAFALLAMVLVATAGLHVDADSLLNVRYSYEPALAACVLLGLGSQGLPRRWQVPALAAVVLVHGFVLDQNRQNWLRASSTYTRMERAIQQAAAQRAVRVFDAPGMYDGAYVYLIERSEVVLWPPFAPGPAPLPGRVTSADEWPASLRELADLAAAKQPLEHAFTVAWDDGALVPMTLDPQWPKPLPGSGVIGYARIGRQRPFLGSELPVQVLLRGATAVTLQVRAKAAGEPWAGPLVTAAAAGANAATEAVVLVPLPLPRELAPDVPIEVELHVRAEGQELHFPLGAVTPVPRRRG